MFDFWSCFCMRACVSGFEYVCGGWVCLTFGLVLFVAILRWSTRDVSASGHVFNKKSSLCISESINQRKPCPCTMPTLDTCLSRLVVCSL
jgi:hypothetical protein